MSLKIKRIYKNETLENLPTELPCFLTDEFQIWYYAVLDADTVLVVSSNSCQVQTFDETFNSKYSVTFDELSLCNVAEFDEVYSQVRKSLTQADQLFQTQAKADNVRVLAGQITAQAS